MEECHQQIAEYLSKCHFEALGNNELTEFKSLASHDDSHLLFPTTVRRFLAGSRAEQLYIESSDFDYIYEVGPGMVTPDCAEGEECRFYCVAAENIGFYYVFDNNKQKISPATIKARLFTMIAEPRLRSKT